jgi:hypothetical protein
MDRHGTCSSHWEISDRGAFSSRNRAGAAARKADEVSMKHPAIRQVFNYRNERRADRAAPDRDDIEPSDLRGALADTFILSFDPRLGHPFRLAGTRVCALFGREMKGEAFLDIFWDGARDQVRLLMAVIARESIGVVANANEFAGAPNQCALELLLLPLRYNGRTDGRLLGALARGYPPDRLGMHTLGDLVPGSYRFLGGYDSHPCTAPLQQGRLRQGLVVYDGGQA